MNKQGVYFRQVVMVFYLVVAAIVMLTLVERARYVIDDLEYVDAYSKNIALTINSMFYSDYNPEVTFIIPPDFKINILDNKVKVSIFYTEGEYDYIPDNNFKINSSRESDKLILRKVKK